MLEWEFVLVVVSSVVMLGVVRGVVLVYKWLERVGLHDIRVILEHGDKVIRSHRQGDTTESQWKVNFDDSGLRGQPITSRTPPLADIWPIPADGSLPVSSLSRGDPPAIVLCL